MLFIFNRHFATLKSAVQLWLWVTLKNLRNLEVKMLNQMMEIWFCWAEALSYCDGRTSTHIFWHNVTQRLTCLKEATSCPVSQPADWAGLVPTPLQRSAILLEIPTGIKAIHNAEWTKKDSIKKKIKVMPAGINSSSESAEAAFFPFLLLDPVQNWIDEWWSPNWQEESNKNFLLSQFSFQVKFASLRMISTSVVRHADFLL